jgi:hypothetical protein
MICNRFADFQIRSARLLILSLIHFCGRGSEVKVVHLTLIFLKTPGSEFDGEVTDQIANVSLYRTKTKSSKHPRCFEPPGLLFDVLVFHAFALNGTLNESDTMPQLLSPFVRNVKVDQSEAATVESLDSAAGSRWAAFTAEMGAHGVTAVQTQLRAKEVPTIQESLAAGRQVCFRSRRLPVANLQCIETAKEMTGNAGQY